MGTLLKTYRMVLQKYPLLTQSVQTGLLVGIGDIIAQTVVEKTDLDKVNLKRTAQFTSVGLFLAGPVLSTWYKTLAKLFGQKKGDRTAVLKKVALDQCIFAPSFICVFLSALGMVQGKDPKDTVADIKRNYLDIMKTNYTIWPWVQLGNFYIVPLQYQVLVVQLFAIIWNTYLSWKTHSDMESKK